jgi:hypothetical protein
MSTLSWMEILLFVSVIVGTGFYYLGHAMGREQQKHDHEARLASMRNHPSYALRIQQWQQDKSD